MAAGPARHLDAVGELGGDARDGSLSREPEHLLAQDLLSNLVQRIRQSVHGGDSGAIRPAVVADLAGAQDKKRDADFREVCAGLCRGEEALVVLLPASENQNDRSFPGPRCSYQARSSYCIGQA